MDVCDCICRRPITKIHIKLISSSAEGVKDCVAKFTSLVRARDFFLPFTGASECFTFWLSPARYYDSDSQYPSLPLHR